MPQKPTNTIDTGNLKLETRNSPILSVAFVSLGCPKNLVDSEKMLGLLAEDGIAITADHEEADAIVINTCGFLQASKTESLEVIREALASKTAAAAHGHNKRVIVAGCLVQRLKEQLLHDAPGIDALVGVFDRQHIVSAVRGTNSSEPRPSGSDLESDLGPFHPFRGGVFIHKPTRATLHQGYTDSDRARLRLTPRHYAYLRISEGCNQGCTFCTIPAIRGRMRSKPLPHILEEAAELLADGAVELNLIGQDTTSYGSDINYPEGLPGLLRALDKLVSKLAVSDHWPLTTGHSPWLRLMYAYPSCFTDTMIKTLADCPYVVKYIDLPLQHINDHILHAMRRKVTRKHTEVLLDKLRRWVPGITLRTTFISGFPGETPAQHRELLRFIQDFRFDNLGVFEFSPEPNTPAARLHAEHPVPPELAAERKQELMLAQQKIVQQKNAALVGTTLPVLIDSINPSKKTATARHPGQAPDIDGTVLLKHCPKTLAPGQLVAARITDFNYYDLIATPIVSTITTPPEIGNQKSKIKNSLSLPILSLEPRRSTTARAGTLSFGP